jgi:excisionase family DNA binding protein
MQNKYTTKQVADMLNIDKSTLLRWIRQEKIPDVCHRDGRNWRVWLPEDVEQVKLYHEKIHQLTLNLEEEKAVKSGSAKD